MKATLESDCANQRSDFSHGLHYSSLRHRDGDQSLQVRTVCAAKEVEHDDLHRHHIFSVSADLDAHRRLAHVQPMLWQSDLVSGAIRAHCAGHSQHSSWTLLDSRLDHQHPIDA